MVKKSLLNILMPVVFLFAAFPLFAQNGIPLEEIRGIYGDEDDSEEFVAPGSVVQAVDPSDSSTFYNSQNWPLGDAGTSDSSYAIDTEGSVLTEAQAQEEDSFDVEVLDDDSDYLNNFSYEYYDEAGETIATTSSAAEKIRSAEEKKKKEKLPTIWHFSAGYMSFMDFPFASNCAFSYFNTSLFGAELPFSWNLIGGQLRARRVFFPFPQGGGFGLVVDGSASYMSEQSSTYSLSCPLYNLNLSLSADFRLSELFTVGGHFGGGALVFYEPTVHYVNGYNTDTYVWIYPDITLGVTGQYFITGMFSVNADVNILVPILMDVGSIVIQIAISAGVNL